MSAKSRVSQEQYYHSIPTVPRPPSSQSEVTLSMPSKSDVTVERGLARTIGRHSLVQTRLRRGCLSSKLSQDSIVGLYAVRCDCEYEQQRKVWTNISLVSRPHLFILLVSQSLITGLMLDHGKTTLKSICSGSSISDPDSLHRRARRGRSVNAYDQE